MRLAGVVLVLLGLVATVLGTFSGCGSLFSWNGRHATAFFPLEEGANTQTLVPEPGRRYTVSVQVVFEREGLVVREGAAVVQSRMPLVVRVKDPHGTTRAESMGWLDPGEPPNVLYGGAARPSAHAPPSAMKPGTPELVVERLVGPFMSSDRTPLSVVVDLGADRIDSARILERRLVIYDDKLPPTIRNAFIVAVAGLGALASGVVLLVVGWFRRRGALKRGGIRSRKIV
ncbi:MAG TPA: hypothetical protein VM580_24120 [Labilithrix sp.]|nr:hypothetical protein [Labilithrix sp.]